MADHPDLQEQLDKQRQRVDVDHFDIPVRELVRMVSEGELKTAPAYQRQFRWDKTRESELVESLLLGLPVPPLFVATDRDGTWELVDGLQRVSTLVHFISADSAATTQISKSAPLRLEGLTKLSAFEGLLYADLPTPMQLAFNKRPLRVTALSDKPVGRALRLIRAAQPGRHSADPAGGSCLYLPRFLQQPPERTGRRCSVQKAAQVAAREPE